MEVNFLREAFGMHYELGQAEENNEMLKEMLDTAEFCFRELGWPVYKSETENSLVTLWHNFRIAVEIASKVCKYSVLVLKIMLPLDVDDAHQEAFVHVLNDFNQEPGCGPGCYVMEDTGGVTYLCRFPAEIRFEKEHFLHTYLYTAMEAIHRGFPFLVTAATM